MEISPNYASMAIHAAIFVAMMWFLNANLIQPMLKVLKERDRRIEGNQKEADTLLAQAKTAVDTYETRLAAARGEANDLRLKIRKEAADKQAAILSAASEKAAASLAAMKERIDAESRSARTALRADAERIAQDLAGKILGRPVA
ncbi:MAG: ATP synthase F0 subunit B [Candidatus Methylomirabilis sp.]|nr:ATP synthase F0 subunit B [Deltaproteobacteria bacterium]